jgi:hypothetical protein
MATASKLKCPISRMVGSKKTMSPKVVAGGSSCRGRSKYPCRIRPGNIYEQMMIRIGFQWGMYQFKLNLGTGYSLSFASRVLLQVGDLVHLYFEGNIIFKIN